MLIRLISQMVFNLKGIDGVVSASMLLVDGLNQLEQELRIAN